VVQPSSSRSWKPASLRHLRLELIAEWRPIFRLRRFCTKTPFSVEKSPRLVCRSILHISCDSF